MIVPLKGEGLSEVVMELEKEVLLILRAEVKHLFA